MSSAEPHPKFYHSITFRLTLWYAIIYIVSSFAMVLSIYVLLLRDMDARIDESLTFDAMELKNLYRLYGMDRIESEFGIEADIEGTDKVFFRLLTTEGQQLKSSDLRAWKGISASPDTLSTLEIDTPRFETVRLPGHQHHVRMVYLKTDDQQYILQIGFLKDDDERFMNQYRHVSVVMLILGLGIGITLGWFMARRAVTGLKYVTETARLIGTGEFSRRAITSDRGDEIDQLAITFNRMLDKIQSLISELKHVISDIAHDFRGPLTRIRGAAETTLLHNKDLQSYQDMAGLVVQEADRLTSIVHSVIEIAEADSGIASLRAVDVDLHRLIQDACDLIRPLAEDKLIVLEIDMPHRSLFIKADESRLQRVFANLLDNAVKYTNAGGRISVWSGTRQSAIIVEIKDTGIGMSEQDLPHIFKRFYRADRSRSSPGNGLGLSLAQSYVAVHGGSIEVESIPNHGTTFRVVLPEYISTVSAGS